MTPGILKVIAGVSSFFGLIGLLGYFFLEYSKSKAAYRSLRELSDGDHLFGGEEITKVLGGFKTDKARLQALQAVLKNEELARKVLKDAKGRADLKELDQQQNLNITKKIGIAAIVFLMLAVLSVVGAFVTDAKKNISKQPEGFDVSENFDVFFHDRKLDLSNWQFVPNGEVTKKISQAVWTDKLKVKRLNNKIKTFVIRHATTGIPDPEFWSDTHRIKAKETNEQPKGGMRSKIRIFDVAIDVGGEPVGQWFELHLSAKYWNAFNNNEKAWAGFPIVHKTESAVFEIQFPSNKTLKYWERRKGSRDTTESELITDTAATISQDNKELVWEIVSPKKNWVYRVNWEW